MSETNSKTGELVFTPLGESKAIRITKGMLLANVIAPTKKGNQASDADVNRFMMICHARQLNPWTGDAYLLGYESKDGPKFDVIVAIQALYKRAELNPSYAGLESGVIVIRDGEEIELVGSLLQTGDRLVGGWSKWHRADRMVPYYNRVSLKTYDTGRSRWAKDPAGMIQKVAEAAGGRKAFPTEAGGLYCREEMDRKQHDDAAAEIPKGVDGLRAKVVEEEPKAIEEKPVEVAIPDVPQPSTEEVVADLRAKVDKASTDEIAAQFYADESASEEQPPEAF